MDYDDIPVVEYDRDGHVVATYTEQVPRVPPTPGSRIDEIEARLQQMGTLADALNPDAATSLAGARAQILAIKTILQAGKKA